MILEMALCIMKRVIHKAIFILIPIFKKTICNIFR